VSFENEDKIFTGVYRDTEGKFTAASVHWPCPPCISYFRADLNTWFYKSMNDNDYVKVEPGSVHAIDCFEQIKKDLCPEEQIAFNPKHRVLVKNVDTEFVEV
jgi:hypothetical protein